MSNKIKASVSVFMMSVTFYLALDTKYVNALGDFVLEFLGFSAWSGDNTGLHLTAIYFSVLFLVSLIFVGIYAIDKLDMKRKKVFLIFIVLVISYTLITGMTAQYIKKNSDGLLTIAYNSENSMLNYKSQDDEIIKFDARFILENYSNEKKEFFISIDSHWLREDKIDKIEILNNDGTRARFVLQAGESKSFNITLEEYMISGGRMYSNGSSRSNISEIILSTQEGDIVKLTSDNFFGMALAK